MRLHTHFLTVRDIYDAASAAGDAVNVSLTRHGSRSRHHAFNVTLTGSSSRRPGNGNGGRFRDDDAYGEHVHAATWDEWGMFLAELYRRDAHMIAGSPGSPTYADAEHFRWTTGARFDALTPRFQHGGSGHKWQYRGTSPSGVYSVAECTTCEAIHRRTRDIATYRAFVADEVTGMSATTGTGIYGGGECAYVLDGYDTDGTPWHYCTAHDALEISPDAPCARATETTEV